MCGISGIIAFSEKGKEKIGKIDASLETLRFRGPDSSGTYFDEGIAIGQTRLSIIDTSVKAKQPLFDATNRYVIVFNGEFFNYMEHKPGLIKKGYQFNSDSDTEVLLNLFIDEGIDCLKKVNGFFAFAIYDTVEKSVFIGRDRMGIKPLLIFEDEDNLIFGSEMKALLAYDIPPNLDKVSLYTYLQLNYTPGPESIYTNVRKLKPGNFLIIKQGKVEEKSYYHIPYNPLAINKEISYEDAKKKVIKLIDASVERRLVSDVPLGAFLSGGIDSSVIVASATQHIKDLNTFSIGYKDSPFFDETQYANLVAKKFNTNHTVYKLSNEELFEDIQSVLDYIDEPFADSSALAVHILCKQVRKKITVVLSGDGADELFSGYNKHSAELRVMERGGIANLVKLMHPIWKTLPKSRNEFVGNKVRQLYRFSEGMNLSAKDRYWRWCSLTDEIGAEVLMSGDIDKNEYHRRKAHHLQHIQNNDINDVLYSDMHLVLQNDMLTKVDLMSMANSLEVRVPFLDYELVNFIFSLPSSFKINSGIRKRILQDAYRTILPTELYNRPKHGFEVPLLDYFKTEYKGRIMDDYLADNFIRDQGLFNLDAIQEIKQRLVSNNPGDVHAQIWGLIVFQNWWRKWNG